MKLYKVNEPKMSSNSGMFEIQKNMFQNNSKNVCFDVDIHWQYHNYGIQKYSTSKTGKNNLEEDSRIPTPLNREIWHFV